MQPCMSPGHSRPGTTNYLNAICTPSIGIGDAVHSHVVGVHVARVTTRGVVHIYMRAAAATGEIDLAGYTYFVSWVMTWVVYDNRKSTTRWHTKLQPVVQVHHNVVTAGCDTSARKAHTRMTLENGVKRGVRPRLLVLLVRLLVLGYLGALARWGMVSKHLNHRCQVVPLSYKLKAVDGTQNSPGDLASPQCIGLQKQAGRATLEVSANLEVVCLKMMY